MCSTVTGKQHFPERGLHIAVIGKIKGIHFKDNWYFLMHKPYREQVVKVILCFLSSVSTPIVCVCVCYWSLDTSNAVTSPIILSYWVFWKMLFMLFFCNVTHPHTKFLVIFLSLQQHLKLFSSKYLQSDSDQISDSKALILC